MAAPTCPPSKRRITPLQLRPLHVAGADLHRSSSSSSLSCHVNAATTDGWGTPSVAAAAGMPLTRPHAAAAAAAAASPSSLGRMLLLSSAAAAGGGSGGSSAPSGLLNARQLSLSIAAYEQVAVAVCRAKASGSGMPNLKGCCSALGGDDYRIPAYRGACSAGGTPTGSWEVAAPAAAAVMGGQSSGGSGSTGSHIPKLRIAGNTLLGSAVAATDAATPSRIPLPVSL